MNEMLGDHKVYFIPDNFIEENTVLQGNFKLRYLIEGIIMGLITASLAILFVVLNPSMPLEAKIVLVILTGGPATALGIVGYNGDPISVVLKSAIAWSKHKITMLYNPNPRLLKQDPVLSVINETRAVDDLFEKIEKGREEKLMEKVNISLEEGKDFKFSEDQYVDQYTKRKRKKSVKEQGGRKAEKEYLINPESSGKGRKSRSEQYFNPDEDLYSEDDEISLSDDLGDFKRTGSASLTLAPNNENDIGIDFDEDIDF